MKEIITKLIKKRISFNKKKAKDCEETLFLSGMSSPLASKVEGTRLYHLGAIKELKELLKEMESLKNEHN